MGDSDGKESACNAGDLGSIPGLGRWLPTPVFSPGEFHGPRSLAGYSPWGHKESDMTERLGTHMVVLFLVFQGISILFSIVAISIYIPTNSTREFPFLHTLSSIYL